jgi:hypothetical protein
MSKVFVLFFLSKKLANISKILAKLVKFTLEKKNSPEIFLKYFNLKNDKFFNFKNDKFS